MYFRHSLAALTALMLTLNWAGNAQQYSFRHYGIADGLQNLAVLSLAQDRAGYIWAGSEGGLYRYDGSHFRLMAGPLRRMALSGSTLVRRSSGSTGGASIPSRG